MTLSRKLYEIFTLISAITPAVQKWNNSSGCTQLLIIKIILV